MILSVSGSRKIQDYDYFKSKLLEYFPDPSCINRIVTGDAEGTDSHAVRYAIEELKIPVTVWGIKAEYKIDHPLIEYIPPPESGASVKQYIHMRNGYIAQTGDLLLAYWVPYSKGTNSTIKQAKSFGNNIIIINARAIYG